MENNNFRGIPTSLFLNGPKVGIVTDPQDQEITAGIATFTGIATATFPDTNFDFDGGSVALNWYFDGSRILDSSEDSDSTAEIVGFSSATGTGSTITLFGLTSDDDGKEIYFEADYIPSAYSQPAGSVVTAGTARSTANAFNEPLKSLSAEVTSIPKIEITSQPTDVYSADIAEFNVVAEISPNRYERDISYQWQLDESDLTDGNELIQRVSNLQDSIFTITGDDGSSQTIDTSETSVIDNFTPGVTYTVTVSADITVKLDAEGGGGGGSGFRDVQGSTGGKSEGTFTFLNGQTYIIQVGEAGQDGQTVPNGTATAAGGKPGGGDAPSSGSSFNRSGGGGGYTGIFITSVTQENAILIAGGGGGSSGDPGVGGDGGGLEGNIGTPGGTQARSGRGGTQTAGGAGGTAGGFTGEAGSALKGGDGVVRSAGGGGGYFGGGSGTEGPGTGGGGSGYLHPTLITDGTTTTGGSNEGREADGTFSIIIRGVSVESLTKQANLTISGAKTPNLTITSSGGNPPTLVGTSIVESDNGTPTNSERTRYKPGSKGGPQTKYPPNNSTKNELGGFTTDDQSALLFMGSYTSELVNNRSATWTNIRSVGASKIVIRAIRGNDFNGGERPNSNGEDLSVELDAGQSSRNIRILSRNKSGDDEPECSWQDYTIDLLEAEKVTNLQIAIKSFASWEGNPEYGDPTKELINDALTLYKNAGDAYGVNWVRLYDDDNNLIQNLTFNASDKISASVRCKLSADNVVTSPIFSKSASYINVAPRNLLNLETYNYQNATATLSEFDLTNGDLQIDYASYPGNAICLYAGERDIDVEMEMHGGKGEDYVRNIGGVPFTGAIGGEGGYSKIRFTMRKDEEYVLTGLFSGVNAPFLYRKGTLIAVVGGGGSGGQYLAPEQGDNFTFNTLTPADGDGGFGGGINVAGENGGFEQDGRRVGGEGGELIEAGTLPSDGIFGSKTRIGENATLFVAVSPDIKASNNQGGRTLPCPRGVYWRDQGKSPCEDLGTIKFRTPDGTEISNTAEIARGYKSGYDIIQTKGANVVFPEDGLAAGGGGDGGAGATGGDAGANSSTSGGGGSGYTDGSVTVVNTQLGGSTGPAKIIIRRYIAPLVQVEALTKGRMTNHTFINALDITTTLDFDGAIASIIPESPNAPDAVVGTTPNLKHYFIIMNQEYSNLIISNISSTTAGGGSGVFVGGAQKVEGSGTQWRVWFRKNAGFNTYVRSFSVEGII